MEHEPPKNPMEICRCLGLSGYHCRFFECFSTLATPLRKLARKIEKFVWTKLQQQAFPCLKKVLCEAPILDLLQGGKDFVVFSDASRV